MNSKKVKGAGEEFPHTDQIIYISALIFLSIWILDSFIFMFSTALNIFIPLLLRIIVFIGFFILAFILGTLSHKVLFGENCDKTHLITNGIFNYVRHPLYLSILLIYLGLALLTFSIISIIIWFLIFILYNKMATYEEKDLEKIFGKEYSEYQKKVPKWILKLMRRRS